MNGGTTTTTTTTTTRVGGGGKRLGGRAIGWSDATIVASAASTAEPYDDAEVRRACSLLLSPEGLYEFCTLPHRIARYHEGSEIDAIVSSVRELTATNPKGVYLVVNPLKKRPVVSTRVGDVKRRTRLVIDLDTKRPDRNANATDHEKDLAAGVMEAVIDELRGCGFPAPIVADSGNGWHLWYACDLPCDDEVRVAFRDLLHGLAKRYDDETTTIDLTVCKANQLMKLPGTWARKGPNLPDRPHRLARMTSIPETIGVIDTLAVLRNAADRIAAPPVTTIPTSTRKEEDAPLLDGWKPTLGGIASDPETAERRRREAYAESAFREELTAIATAGQGDRNNRLFRSVAALANFLPLGLLDENRIRIECGGAALSCGLSAHEIGATLDSAIRVGRETPRVIPPPSEFPGTGAISPTTTPPLPPPPIVPEWGPIVPLSELPDAPAFPLGVLPEACQRFAWEVSEAINCPLDFVTLPVLSVASTAIGNTCRLAVKGGHSQSAALWTCFVGEPGAGKSPPLAFATEPLVSEEARRIADWRKRNDEWKAKVKAGTATPEEEPTRPERLTIDGITGEELVRMLSENNRGLLLCRDELTAMVSGMNQYRQGGKGDERQLYLTLWSNGIVKHDRKSNAEKGVPLVAYKPFLAVTGGIQPGKLTSLRSTRAEDNDDADGFFTRFLLAYPHPRPAVPENWREVSDAAIRGWADVVASLLRIPLHVDPADGRVSPRPIPLSGPASDPASGMAAWWEFTRDHADEVNDDGFDPDLRNAWSKLRGYVPRLALVLHCLRDAARGASEPGVAIDGDTVRAAVELVLYFKGHLRKAMLAGGFDRVNAQAIRIAGLLRSRRIERFKPREIWPSLKSLSAFPTVRSLEEPLRLLERHGYVREENVDHLRVIRVGSGRPESRVWITNPFLHSVS